MADELPVHPLTGLAALGVLPSGRIVWPVLGAAPEGDDDADSGAGDGDAGDGGAGDEGTGDGDQGGDGLGDKGREALAKERKARRDADKARKAAEAKAADLEERLAAGAQQDQAQQDADKVRRDAETAATAKANARILAAEVRAAAAGQLADPSDAARYLDLSEFEVGDDGSVDAEAITEAISDLIKKKPYLAAKAQGFQGTGDGGARTGGSRPKQLTGADVKNMSATEISKARQEGRLERYLSGD
jgi:hypothetical protein